MEFLLSLTYALLFTWLIFRLRFFRCEGISRKLIAGVFFLKIICGVALWAIYTYYYTDRSTADIYKYFDDSKIIFDALKEKPIDYLRMLVGINNDTQYFTDNYYSDMNHWFREYEIETYNDGHTIIRFNAFARLFSFGYYNVHSVFICFLSLIGLTALYKAFSDHFPQQRKELAFAIFLLPSVLFWGSGVLKEGLLLFALGLFVYHFFRLSNRQFNLSGILVLAITTGILLVLKYYIIIAMSPGLIAYFWVKQTGGNGVFWKYGLVMIGGLIAIVNLQQVLPEYDVLQIMVQKQHDFLRHGLAQGSGSYVPITPLEPTLLSLIKVAPEALVNTLLRPFPWNISSPFTLMAALENLLLLIIMVSAILFAKPLKKWDFNLLFMVMSFVLITYLLIGWITPVIGAVVRYKVPAMPFLLIACWLVLDKNRIIKKLPVLNTWL